jgi:hypothetical protein
MMTTHKTNSTDEPVGIVISRGKRDEPAPAFWAYVWGPVPETELPPTESKAA